MGTATFTNWLSQNPDEWGNLQGTTPPTLIVDPIDGITSLDVNVAGAGTSAAKLGALNPFGTTFGNPQLSMPVSYERIYLRWLTLPVANDEMFHIIADQVNEKCSIRLNSAGQISFYAGTGGGGFQFIDTGKTALAFNTWYRVEFQCGTGNPAFWEILLAVGDVPSHIELNGVSSLGGPTSAGSFQTIWGKERNFNNNTVHWQFRDFFWTDQGYVGPGHCIALQPSIDGSYGHGTPNGATSLWQCVADLPPDEDVTYINGLTNGQAYTTRTAGGLRGSINSVKAYARARSNDGATNIMWNTRLRSGGVDTDTTYNGLSDLTYLSRQKLSDTDPATGKPWTDVGVNAAEVGFIQNSAAAMRATSAYIMADYLAAPPARLVSGPYFWRLKGLTSPAGFQNRLAAYLPSLTVGKADMTLDSAGLAAPFSLAYFSNLGSQSMTVKDSGKTLVTLLPGTARFLEPQNATLGKNVPAVSGGSSVEYCLWS